MTCVQIGSHWRSVKFHAKDWSHVAIAQKRIHQWCLTLTPSNTETIERMTYHCFLRPIRRGPYEQLLHNRKHSPKTQWRNALHMSEKYNSNKKEKKKKKKKKKSNNNNNNNNKEKNNWSIFILVLRPHCPALSKWLCLVSHSKEITMNEKPYLIANIGTLNLLFWTRMSVVEDKECKSCPSYYQSTGNNSEENEGVP